MVLFLFYGETETQAVSSNLPLKNNFSYSGRK